MISRFQTAVDYGISPSLFPEPEDDTYDFFEKIETPEGPRVIDVRKRVISTTSNIPQKRRKLQVDSSSRFSSRASLHIQPPSFLSKATAAPTSPPSYNPLTARSPTPVRRPPPAHVAPPSHSPTPVRVLRDISEYTKYGETLLDRPQEEELEQPIDLQEEEEEDIIPTPVFSPSPEASPPPPIHRPSPPRSPQHDRVLRDITRPMDEALSIAKDTDTDISYVDRKGKEAAPVEIDDEEETEANVLHFVRRVAEGDLFENDIASRASSFIEKDLIIPSNITQDSQEKAAVAERQTSDAMFDQDAKQALDRLLMEQDQDQEDQADDELIEEKENFVPIDDTVTQKDPVAVQPIYPIIEETQPADDEDEEEVITTIFDDDEREMGMLFLDEAERMPLPFQRDEDSQLRSPIEKQRSPSLDLDDQPLVITEPEIEKEEAEKEVEEVNDEQSDEDIEQVQPRRSSTPSRILETIFDRKENEEAIADEADVASDREVLEEAGEVDVFGRDEEQGVDVNLSVAAEENFATLEDEEPSQIASPVEQESKLPPMSPVTAIQNPDTSTERRESYHVSEYEEEQTLDQMLMDHRLHRPTTEEYIGEDHFQEDDEDDISLDHVREDAIEEDLAGKEHNQDEPAENEDITEGSSIVKGHTNIQYETVDQSDEVDENDEAEAGPSLSISHDSEPSKQAEISATVFDEEERKLDMTLFEEVEGLNAPHHDDEDSQPRSPVQDQRSPSPEAYHQEHEEKAQASPPPSPSPDHEEQALDRLLLEEVDAFGSAESIGSLEKENKAIASPEPSFYATRTPSPHQDQRYHERLQSGYSGQPRSALEVIRDTLSQNQLPTPPRSSPNISVIKGQDVLLKKMETTDLNRSFAQLHASYTSTRQNRTEPRREANEMDVVSEAIGQVMAPYQ